MTQTPNEYAESQRLRHERTETLRKFFAEVPVPDMDRVSVNSTLGILDHPGFRTLVGLMNGERNALLTTLANTALDSPTAIARASVLQGRVQGIDSLYSTLVEVANYQPSPATEKTS